MMNYMINKKREDNEIYTAVRLVYLLNVLSRSMQKYVDRPCRQDS
jgi:hypothetical protein